MQTSTESLSRSIRDKSRRSPSTFAYRLIGVLAIDLRCPASHGDLDTVTSRDFCSADAALLVARVVNLRCPCRLCRSLVRILRCLQDIKPGALEEKRQANGLMDFGHTIIGTLQRISDCQRRSRRKDRLVKGVQRPHGPHYCLSSREFGERHNCL